MYPRRIAVLVASLLLLTLGLGCYETKYPLGSAENATVDRAFVGNFTMKDGNVDSIVIRNLDGKRYYVEYVGNDQKDKQPMRMVGYTTDVGGVTFANLQQLTDDGSIDDKFLIMRISLSADHATLSLRGLKEEFFKDKDVNSSADLEKVIQANLDNDQMYDGPEAIATRTAAATQP
ncbi:MAG TPA: hypothetical protein VHX86_14490 [Tepidisphaeraceae bacterium]|jgi:hypothetical protein|nr:hypothetical protein [Tepidisphaeraceae bacterium]